MLRLIRSAALLLLLTSCTSAPAGGERWWIRLVGVTSPGEGSLLVQLTEETFTPGACIGREMKKAKVLQKRGMENVMIRDVIGVDLREDRFFAELTPGLCDASLALEGTVYGDRASGQVTRSTFAGPHSAGSFTADRLH